MKLMKVFLKNNEIHLTLTIGLFVIIAISGCKKFIEVDPPVTSVNEGNVYEDDATAIAVLTGVWTKMSYSRFTLDMTVYPELAADNLMLYDLNTASYTAYWQNLLIPSNSLTPSFWINLYPYIFSANSAIAGLEKSKTLTAEVKQHLLGEAYFLRAFCYSYLVASYGGVPLALTTDYTENSTLSRSPESKIYAQIISDLKIAQDFLTDGYLQSNMRTVYPSEGEQRVRPNRWSAKALLARAYLYNRDFANAEFTATEIINETSRFSIVPLNQVFLANSRETIWSIQTIKSDFNTDEAELFTLREGGPNGSTPQIIYFSDEFIQSFQKGDQRKAVWTGKVEDQDKTPFYYSSKYKLIAGTANGQEYPVVFRLAEQYLIRAEARIQQDNISGSISDMNILRARAIDKSANEEDQLKLLPMTLSKEETMDALLQERRVELFCEWGHRWFDLSRLGKIDEVMRIAAPIKEGAEWSSYKAIFPVPSVEIRANPAIVQNTGYTN